ncbi:MAG: hypothetical protein NTY08_07950 [Proteobacteria bacterium]|nr:hypothetical protein [Pseudomonadota bacterium]
MISRLRLVVSILLAATTVSACRTTSKRTAPSVEKSAQTQGELALTDAQSAILTKDDGRSTYMKMLTIELDSGAKVPQDQFHTAHSVLECRQLSDIRTCLMRVRLTGDEAAPGQPVPAKITDQAFGFAYASRPELRGEDVIFTDLICDYLGKKSPPYDVEDVTCRIQLPRLPNEAIFEGKLAQELGEAIRGERAYGTQLVNLSGALICQWLESSRRSLCVTRSNVNGVLQDNVVELSQGAAAAAAKGLRQAVIDRSQIASLINKTESSKSAVPSELMSSLSCTVDNTRIESEGTRTYLCRAKV